MIDLTKSMVVMKKYVCGYVFDSSASNVVLVNYGIDKTLPSWFFGLGGDCTLTVDEDMTTVIKRMTAVQVLNDIDWKLSFVYRDVERTFEVWFFAVFNSAVYDTLHVKNSSVGISFFPSSFKSIICQIPKDQSEWFIATTRQRKFVEKKLIVLET